MSTGKNLKKRDDARRTLALKGSGQSLTEFEAAELIGLSVHTLRKDRTHLRRFPFYRVGSAIRYSAERLREALATMEQGGPAARPARRRA